MNYNTLVARGIYGILGTVTQAGSSDAMFFVLVLMISIPLLFITDKRFILIGLFIALTISAGLGIYMQTSWIGITSSLAWLGIALMIIIWKLSMRNREGME